MRHLFIFIAILFFGNARTQVLEEITAPSMPSATIIGTQINEINKPKTLKALEAAILNNFIDPDNNIMLPNNYAIEINPYMLGNRTNFDYRDYLKDSLKENLWKNLSLSIASTNNFIINDTISSNALGFGGRTIILNGKVDQKLEESYLNIIDEYQKLKSGESQIRTMIGVYLNSGKTFTLDSLQIFLLGVPQFRNKEDSVIINEVFKNIPNTTDKFNIRNNFIDSYKKALSANALKQFKELINKVKSERYGLRWEIDAAMALSFPTNDFNYSISPKYSIWSNLSYRPCKNEKMQSGKTVKVPSNFEFIGLLRWIDNNDDFINKYNPTDTTQFKTGNLFDLGLRVVLEYEKISAEFEYIYRLNQNEEYVTVNGFEYSRTINDNTYKFVFNFNYHITDNIILSYNIGKNYDMINCKKGNFISGFSLNFGFGGVKKEDMISAAMKKIN